MYPACFNTQKIKAFLIVLKNSNTLCGFSPEFLTFTLLFMSKQNDLNVRELLKKTYSILCKRYKPKDITFSERALTEIADDSDWHRTKKGYMGYGAAALFQLDGKSWAIVRGEKCGIIQQSHMTAIY